LLSARLHGDEIDSHPQMQARRTYRARRIDDLPIGDLVIVGRLAIVDSAIEFGESLIPEFAQSPNSHEITSREIVIEVRSFCVLQASVQTRGCESKPRCYR
jgi:hypothetical protein